MAQWWVSGLGTKSKPSLLGSPAIGMENHPKGRRHSKSQTYHIVAIWATETERPLAVHARILNVYHIQPGAGNLKMENRENRDRHY